MENKTTYVNHANYYWIYLREQESPEAIADRLWVKLTAWMKSSTREEKLKVQPNFSS